MIRKALLIAVPITILLLAAGYTVLRTKYPPVEGWSKSSLPDTAFETLDPWIKESFTDTTRPDTTRYGALFRYLIAGFLAYRSDGGARAHYPGYASFHGRNIDGMEGFSRIAPLIAAWLAGGRPETVQVPSFGDIYLPGLLRTGIEQGTDPAAEEYWGDIGALDQRVVEASDIALTVWLGRDFLWDSLDKDTRARLVSWLAQADGKADAARFANWHLFPLLVNRTLKSLGTPVSDEAFNSGWNAVKSSYAGNGWFHDSQDNHFDYYNAWSFHYSLYWLTRIDDKLDIDFVDNARKEFVSFYRHLVTPRGFPVLGRSICYRTAMPVPLIIESLMNSEIVSPGEARRALDVTWRYFIEHNALAAGVLTQGYCGQDKRYLNNYSGPASCLWGARSLVVALSQPDHAPLWTAEQVQLPVEQKDFSLFAETPGWQLEGSREQNSVMIRFPGRSGNPVLKPYTLKHRLASALFHRPFGPGNRPARFDRAEYSSASPFCGCVNEQ